MILNPRHAEIQPIFDAIPNYWQVCQYEEINKAKRFYFIRSLVTKFLSR